MDGDRPISRREEDRLGFSPVAEHLACAIVDQPATQGFVLGIEGKWGSGKSTLINLTIDVLKSYGERAPEIIAFSPWLVGDREELLRTLFDELATAAVQIDPIESPDTDEDASFWQRVERGLRRNEHWKLKQKERFKNAIGGKLKAFGRAAGTIGKLARFAGVAGVPGADIASSAFERGGDAARAFVSGASVSKRKAELVNVLKLLSRRIVVFIDDLDRLEPREASEVLRLKGPTRRFGNRPPQRVT